MLLKFRFCFSVFTGTCIVAGIVETVVILALVGSLIHQTVAYKSKLENLWKPVQAATLLSAKYISPL